MEVTKSDVESMNFVGERLAPYNPTSIEAIRIALQLLNLRATDTLYDLGCGDGRLLVEVWNIPMRNIWTILFFLVRAVRITA